MAKVTITFEDVEEGVSVQIESEPFFPGAEASQEEKESITEAQQMGLRMTHLLKEMIDHDHDHDHDQGSVVGSCPYKG